MRERRGAHARLPRPRGGGARRRCSRRTRTSSTTTSRQCAASSRRVRIKGDYDRALWLLRRAEEVWAERWPERGPLIVEVRHRRRHGRDRRRDRRDARGSARARRRRRHDRPVPAADGAPSAARPLGAARLASAASARPASRWASAPSSPARSCARPIAPRSSSSRPPAPCAPARCDRGGACRPARRTARRWLALSAGRATAMTPAVWRPGCPVAAVRPAPRHVDLRRLRRAPRIAARWWSTAMPRRPWCRSSGSSTPLASRSGASADRGLRRLRLPLDRGRQHVRLQLPQRDRLGALVASTRTGGPSTSIRSRIRTSRPDGTHQPPRLAGVPRSRPRRARTGRGRRRRRGHARVRAHRLGLGRSLERPARLPALLSGR